MNDNSIETKSESFYLLTNNNIREGLFSDWRKIAPFAFEIFAIITAFSEDNETSTIPMRKIEALSGLTLPTVHKTILALEKAKVVKKKKRGNRASIYKF